MWYQAAALSQLELDKPISVDVDGEPVMIVRTGAGIFATSDVCTHSEVSLAEGTVVDGKIECWLHGAQFDLATGEALCLPAIKPIDRYNVRVIDASPDSVVEVSLIIQEKK